MLPQSILAVNNTYNINKHAPKIEKFRIISKRTNYHQNKLFLAEQVLSIVFNNNKIKKHKSHMFN